MRPRNDAHYPVTTDVLVALAARQPVIVPALMLVAHPDDEVLGASLTMCGLRSLHLVHATDGAAGAGVGGIADRFAELDSALARLGVAPVRTRLGFPDGTLVDSAKTLAAALAPMLASVELLVTHALEGGHPDHDACALAAQIACARDGASHVTRLEFAVYARIDGAIRTNTFSPGRSQPTVFALSAAEQARKRHALEAFASQRHVVDRFPLGIETLRASSDEDFTRSRNPADVLFAAAAPEREVRWRAAALAAVGA